MIDLRLGESKIQVKITDLQSKKVPFEDKPEPAEKIVIVTETPSGRVYNVDEVWINGKDGKTTKGLWLYLTDDGRILATSTLGRFLRYMSVDSLSALVGKEVTLMPKTNNFMAAIGFNDV